MAIGIVRTIQQGSAVLERDFVLDLTAAPAVGNLCVVVASKDASETMTPPAGWSTINTIASGTAVRVGAYYKIAEAGEPTTYTWTSVSLRKWVLGYFELNGYDEADPVNVNGMSAGTGTAPLSPTITTGKDGCLIIAGFGANNVNTMSVEAGLTPRVNLNSSGGAATGIALGSEEQASQGATGTYTHSSGDNEWVAVTLAVTPAGSAGPIVTTDPSDTFNNKVGDVVDEDANNWITSSGGTLTFGEETLPSGLTLTGATGAIAGTLTQAAGAFPATIEAYDDNATAPNGTILNFTWDISNYELFFSGTGRLENPSGNAFSGTAHFTAYKGTIDTGLTGDPVHWSSKAVATGGIVTLNHADLTSGTWTVFAEEASTGIVLGAYEKVAG